MGLISGGCPGYGNSLIVGRLNACVINSVISFDAFGLRENESILKAVVSMRRSGRINAIRRVGLCSEIGEECFAVPDSGVCVWDVTALLSNRRALSLRLLPEEGFEEEGYIEFYPAGGMYDPHF